MSYYTQFPRRYDELAICLDSYKESGIAGRAYFGSRQEPTLFRDIGALLIQFDGFLDTLGKPQASTALRRFSQKRQKKQGHKGDFHQRGGYFFETAYRYTPQRGERHFRCAGGVSAEFYLAR